MTNTLLDRFRRGRLPWLVLEAAVLALAGAAAAQGRTQPSQSPGIMVPGPGTGSADLTNREGFTVGGRVARPGSSLQIGPGEATRVAGGKCFYEVTYEVTNAGAGPTPQPFTVRLRADGSVIGSHDGLTLRSRESRTLRSVVGLSPGQHGLDLVLDDGNRVPEADERNNQVRALVTVSGPCDQPTGVAQAPLTAQPGSIPTVPPPPGPPSLRSQAPPGPGAGAGPPPTTLQPSPSGALLPAPKLWATQCSGKSVPPDCRLSRPNLVGEFGRESVLPDTLDWRWQVATQPFSSGAAGTPAGLVAQEPIPKKGQASATFFQINFGKFPPLQGPTVAGAQQASAKSQAPAGTPIVPGTQSGGTSYQAAGPPCPPEAQPKVVIDGKTIVMPCGEPEKPSSGPAGPPASPPVTLYVRIVAFQNGLPYGSPSNVVAVTYVPAPLAQLVALVAKVERDKLPLHFKWEDAYFRRKGPSVMPQGVYWHWQLASKSFADTLAPKPSGLLGNGSLSTSEFSLNLSQYLDGPKNLYVRVVPLDNPFGGQLAGTPSNEVVVTYTPYHPDELLPEVHLVSWQGPYPYDWNYRCWQVATHDVYVMDAQGKSTKIIAKGQKKNACKTDDDNILEDIGDAAAGFVEALGDLVNWVSGAFKDLKSSIVNAVASLCGSQKDKCQVVAAIALDTGLTALGVPPNIPNFNQLVAQLKQGGVEILAAELVGAAGAENIPLGQEAAEAAIKKVLDEVEKAAAEGDPKAPVWVPDPVGLYRPAALVLELRNPNFPVPVKVDAIRLTSDSRFVPMEIALKGVLVYPGKTVRVPIFPTPTVAPDAWIKMVPTAQDVLNCFNSYALMSPSNLGTCKQKLTNCSSACKLVTQKEQDAKKALESWQVKYGTTFTSAGLELLTVTAKAGAVSKPVLGLQCDMSLGGNCKTWSQWKQPAYP